MDKNAFIGFALIGLVLMAWMYINAPAPTPPQSPQQDSLVAHSKPVQDAKQSGTQNAGQAATQAASVATDTLGSLFSAHASGPEKFLIVETEDYKAVITSHGGGIRSWVLKKFTTWNKYPMDLLNDTTGELNLLFTTAEGKLVNTRSLNFDSPLTNFTTINLSGQDSFKVEYTLPLNAKSKLVKTLTFTNGKYSFDCSYRFDNMSPVIANYEYQLVWETGLRYGERNSVDESNGASSFAYSGGELTEADAAKMGDSVKQNLSGNVTWVSTRTKYFGLAIIPHDNNQGAYLEGHHVHRPDNGGQEIYSLGVKMPFIGKDQETANFTVYLGPLDYSILKAFHIDLERMMNLGYAWIIRPIAQYVMMPLFHGIHFLIPNWGIVIIIFSILIKLALYPLSKSSMKSMKKMQQLQPLMTEIKEKYKDDPEKLNAATMRLYKEYGVNPAGGCLPLLIQLPILYALWAVFRSTIELRHAPFFGWIHDLAAPDVITTLPFAIPLFNITELSGLALLMGITMFVQQKMTVQDPRQKAMVWMMPVMMTLLFNSFAAGLNLYYFVFNLLQIGQQVWMNKTGGDEPLRKVEEKPGKSGGIMARIAKDMPKLPKR